LHASLLRAGSDRSPRRGHHFAGIGHHHDRPGRQFSVDRCPIWVGVEQQQWLEAAASALVDHRLPARAHLPHSRVVKVNPRAQLGVEEKGGVVLSVVGDQADELVLRGAGAALYHVVENVVQTQTGAQRREDGHNVLERRTLRVPHQTDRHHVWAVGQSATYLDLGATQALQETRNRSFNMDILNRDDDFVKLKAK